MAIYENAATQNANQRDDDKAVNVTVLQHSYSPFPMYCLLKCHHVVDSLNTVRNGLLPTVFKGPWVSGQLIRSHSVTPTYDIDQFDRQLDLAGEKASIASF